MAELVGRKILGYEVLRLLGEGGMGAVYEAHNAELDKRVAIKVLHPHYAKNRQIAARFVQEAIAAARVRQQPDSPHAHENVVQVIGADQLEDGRHFIVLEFLYGKDLEAWLADPHRGPVPVDVGAAIALQVCAALNAAHRAGIVHRDLKPPNVFITSSPRLPQFVKLLDFGIAKLKSDLRATGVQTGAVVMGTCQYMAPEQAEAPMTVDHRADIFALGCVVYRMFGGRLAYPDEVPDGHGGVRHLDYGEILAAQRDGVAPPALTSLRPDLDPRWDVIIARCLSYDREGRYPNVRALALDIVAATPEGGEIFAAVWPDFAAAPEDLTVPNDGVVPARRGPVTPPPPSSPRLTSHAAAAGARTSTQTGTGTGAGAGAGRWLGMAAVAVVGLVVGVVVAMRVGGDEAQEGGRASSSARGDDHPTLDGGRSTDAGVATVAADAAVADAAVVNAAVAATNDAVDAGGRLDAGSRAGRRERDRGGRSRSDAAGSPPIDAGPGRVVPVDAGPPKKVNADDLLLGR